MKKILSVICCAVVLIFMFIPILILAVYSFTDASNIGQAMNFSIENYRVLFTTPELIDMIVGTIVLAVGSALIATVLGTMGAMGAFYSRRTARGLYNTVNQIPIVNAEVVTGFSICVLMIAFLGMSKESFVPLVIGHVVLLSPFVFLSVMPRLKQMDRSLYEAALDLGATSTQAIFKVTIPQILPGILSGFMLAITLSLDDYFITTYTKPPTFDTISTYVVNATRGSQTQIKTALWALSTLIFVLVVLIVVLMNVVGKNKGRKENVKI